MVAEPAEEAVDRREDIVDTDAEVGIQTGLVVDGQIDGGHGDAGSPQPRTGAIFEP